MGCFCSKPKETEDAADELATNATSDTMITNEDNIDKRRPDSITNEESGEEEEVKKPVADEDVDQIQVVVRQEIRQMSSEEQQRFVNCLKKLMEGEPGKSEWHRLAGYHGWPEEYCAHRNESFPGWHRAYLKEIEAALQIADRKLGGDGNIGLPFWDWLDFGDGEFFPKIIRDNFAGLPEKFFEDPEHPLAVHGFDNASDRQLIRKVKDSYLEHQVVACLLEDEHFKHASANWSRDTSVESPHDQIHVAVGWPMTSVAYAAFNPIFWLHHNNIDRIYSKYLQLEPDSHAEYENFQKIREESGEPNLYEQKYEPFKHPFTGEDFLAKDTFDTEKLGYKYSYLPDTPSQQMKAFPTLAAWLQVEVVDLKQVSYEMHVFVVPKDMEAKELEIDFNNEESWKDNQHYGGWTALFGGKGESCENCRTTKPVNRTIDISRTLNNLEMRRGDCKLRVITVSTRPDAPGQTICWYEDLSEDVREVIPPAVCAGPIFDNMNEMLQEGAFSAEQAEKLQEYLTRYGYYTGKLDGDFGPKTAASVTLFQKIFGLEVDGIAGPQTKTLMITPRFDGLPDINEEETNGTRNYDVEKLTYWVGTSPGYLNREGVLQEIEESFGIWSGPAGVAFESIGDREAADITVMFTDQSRTNPFLFDGSGGVLAKGAKGSLEFDASERWLLYGEPEKHNQYYLKPVAIHEIGHILGLDHSKRIRDVMAPYYKKGGIELTENDIARLTDLYKPLEAN